jgi:hypothetical protein
MSRADIAAMKTWLAASTRSTSDVLLDLFLADCLAGRKACSQGQQRHSGDSEDAKQFHSVFSYQSRSMVGGYGYAAGCHMIEVISFA